MQCGVEERVVRNVRTAVVMCFKYGEEEHKCRECPLWIKKKKGKAVHMAGPRKAQQKERPACPIRGKAQEKKKRLRKVEKEEAAHPIEGKVQQGEYRRSS